MQASAATVFIQNEITPLNYVNDIYYWPQNLAIKPGVKNLFISMDGVRKICFLDQAEPGLFEQISEITIIIKGVRTDWNCFPYTTTITEARP